MSERLGEELERALRGDRASLRVLVGELTPVIQARVARVLLRSATGRQAGRAVRQEVEDMTQEVFVSLLEDGGKALRSWAPERGASLKNFVGLLAERQAMSILRSGRRSPWPRELAEVPGDDAPSPVRLEQAIESREMRSFRGCGLRLAQPTAPAGSRSCLGFVRWHGRGRNTS
jgi:RNA polymerase sigma-70 factor (ECF subfamily)